MSCLTPPPPPRQVRSGMDCCSASKIPGDKSGCLARPAYRPVTQMTKPPCVLLEVADQPGRRVLRGHAGSRAKKTSSRGRCPPCLPGSSRGPAGHHDSILRQRWYQPGLLGCARWRGLRDGVRATGAWRRPAALLSLRIKGGNRERTRRKSREYTLPNPHESPCGAHWGYQPLAAANALLHGQDRKEIA